MRSRLSVRMARTAISPRFAIKTVENMAMSLFSLDFSGSAGQLYGQACKISPPGTEGRDVFRARQPGRFADETFHELAVLQLQSADTERRRNLGDEGTKTTGREVPQLHGNGGALGVARCKAQESRLGGTAPGKREKAIVRRGPGRGDESSATGGELMVERHTAQVSADNGETHGPRQRRRQIGSLLSQTAARGAQHGAARRVVFLPSAAERSQSAVVPGGSEERHAGWKTIASEPGG